MEFIYVIAVIAFVILSAVNKSGKQKQKQQNKRRNTGRPSDMQDKLESFLDAVTEVKIPEKVLETIPFLKPDPEPAAPAHTEISPPSPEGTACDIPHSLTDPRPVPEAAEGLPCDIPHSLLDPRLAQAAPVRAPEKPDGARPMSAPRYSARDLRQAVITSEILSRPVSLRRRRSF